MTPLYESTMQRLLERVAEGELRPGDWLPSEKRMEAELRVSRGVARETIQALKERGVVDKRHGRGQWVRDEADWNVLDPHVLAALVAAGRFDLLRQVVECRALFGTQVAGLAAQRATAESRDRLAAAYARLHDAIELRRRPLAAEDPFVAAETDFHGLLARMAGNQVAARILAPVDAGLAILHHSLAGEQRAAVVRPLDRLRKAVEAADADAARTALERSVAQTRRLIQAAAG